MEIDNKQKINHFIKIVNKDGFAIDIETEFEEFCESHNNADEKSPLGLMYVIIVM